LHILRRASEEREREERREREEQARILCRAESMP
jgi:hypothetical protein